MSKATKISTKHLHLKGQLLLAMPGMEDTRFEKTVVLICSHNDEGSMGFILNQPVASPDFSTILQELGLDDELPSKQDEQENVPIFCGGPVEQGRGFVLHTLDYSTKASARVGDLAGVTATLDALKKLAGASPPEHSLMLLGYAGWSEGQLEDEIANNGWLTMPASHSLVFETHHAMQYDTALASMGISQASLSSTAGHA